MKILYLHQHFSTPKGATGTRSYEFAKKLLERGHSVTIVCGSYWIAESGLTGDFVKGRRMGVVDGINVIELGLNYSNADSYLWRTFIFLRYSWHGIKIAFKEDYDLLFATSTPLTAGIPGILAHLFKRKPFIFEVRDLWPELPKAMGVITNPIILKLMDWLETISYKSATACIGLSPGIIAGIKKKAPNKNIAMIPNGCDLNLVEKRSNGRINNKFIAVFTGAHGFANGLDAVLNAAKILLQKNEKDIEIQFIGDGILKPKLIQRVEEENISNCKFINPMPKPDLFNYLQKEADVGLMILDNIPAFYYGTSPNKFFDYIALPYQYDIAQSGVKQLALGIGTPVIVNKKGGLHEGIINGENGFIVENNSKEEWVATLKLLNKIKFSRKKIVKMNEAKYGEIPTIKAYLQLINR